MSRQMKDSGVEWLGEIPADWELSRVGRHFDIILGKMLCTNKPTDDYTLEPYYCAANVHFDGVLNDNLKQMWFSPTEKEQYLVSHGDLLVVEGGAGAGGCAIVTEPQQPTYIQNSVMIVRSRTSSSNCYLKYLLECLVKSGYINVICNKATIPHFTKDKLANVPMPRPPLDEQQRIANFLDDRCACIDSVVAKTRASIEEYKKLKQSVITRAVTKGIRPNRPMKDSGVEWIGDIPADWNVIRLKHIARFVQTKYTAADGDLNYIGLENVVGWDGTLIETDSVYDRDQSLICTTGDILFGKLRPYLAKVYLNTVKQCCSAEFAVIRMNAPLCRPFFRYQLISHGFIFTIDSSTYGAKMPRANVDFVKNMRVVVPPLDEQKEIADYLDEKTAQIDSLIAKKNQLVSEMESLKKSLIFEYVTGKKEIPT